MTATLTGYRFRNDDGDEASATWMAALNTPVSFDSLSTPFRLRFAIAEDVGGEFLTLTVEYNVNGAGWTALNASSGDPVPATSPHVADNTPTTQQISSGAFSAGVVIEDDSAHSAFPSASSTLEEEWVLELLGFSDGDVVQFRIANSGVAITSDVTPQLTFGAAFTPQQFRPDADIDAADWTPTPLWSKVNETSADGTTISSTAS